MSSRFNHALMPTEAEAFPPGFRADPWLYVRNRVGVPAGVVVRLGAASPVKPSSTPIIVKIAPAPRLSKPIAPAIPPRILLGRRIYRYPLVIPMPSVEQVVFANGEAIKRVEEIQRIVCRVFNVTLLDLRSARRTAEIVMPRQIAMWLSKKLTLKSFPEIGRRFGGRDHTTVLHAVRKIERLIAGSRLVLPAEIASLAFRSEGAPT